MQGIQMSLLIIALCWAFTVVVAASDLVEALRREVSSVSLVVPEESDLLISGITTSGAFDTAIISPDALQDHWPNLPAQVRDRFRASAFSESTTFEIFTISINPQESEFTEFLCASRRSTDNMLELIYIHSLASGSPIQQFDHVQVKKCHSCWLFLHCCKDVVDSIKRGYTVEEVEAIAATLRASAYIYVNGLLEDPPVSLSGFGYHVPQPAHSNASTMARNLITGLAAYIPDIKKHQHTHVPSQLVYQITGRGINHFKQNCNIQQLMGVSLVDLPQFQGWINDMLGLPERYAGYLSNVVKVVSHSHAENWLLFHIVYSSGADAACRYVVLMGRRNAAEGTLDWLYVEVRSVFELGRSVFVVRSSVSTLWGSITYTVDDIYSLPSSITNEDVSDVFDFFTVVVLEKFVQVLDIVPVTPNLGFPVVGIIAAVSTVLDWWPKLVTAFKTSITSEVVGQIAHTGFDYFQAHSFMDHVEDLEKAYIPEYVDMLIDEIKVPASRRSTLIKHLNLLPHLENTEFAIYDMVYSTESSKLLSNGDPGSCKYVCVMVHTDAVNGTSTFLVADVQAEFHLAPDTIVIRKERSILGGIYEDSRIEFQHNEGSFNATDIESVLAFFKIVAFNGFAKLLQIPVNEHPDI